MKNAHAAVAFALAFLMLPVFALAEEPPKQTLEAKVNVMLSSMDEAYVTARKAVAAYILAGGEDVEDEIAALPPLERFVAMGVDKENADPSRYADVAVSYDKAVVQWSVGFFRMAPEEQPLFFPWHCPTIGEPMETSTGNGPSIKAEPDSVIVDNQSTRAFLLSVLALGRRSTKVEFGIERHRMDEYGDLHRWIALRILGMQIVEGFKKEIADLFADVCKRTDALENKGFFWSASEVALLGSEKFPELAELFPIFAARLPYAIHWTEEDDSRWGHIEDTTLFEVPYSLYNFMSKDGILRHPVGYVLEMTKQAWKVADKKVSGPTPIYAPKHPAKPPEPPKPPANGAQIPGQGLAVAVLLVGVVAFQVRKNAGRK
ncbi:MAG: hypothetical protein WC712_05985 [Candidatus Brocadiia bacterium]